MFARFENLVDSYPIDEGGMPPTSLLAFILHYSKPVLPLVLVSSAIAAFFSIVEVAFFGALGGLIDWLAASDRATFVGEHGGWLLALGVAVLVCYPALVLIHNLLFFQGIFGQFAMIVRWRAHRYLLGQSVDFFQNEFAGRISQKVMQTALAVRESVLKILDIGVYVGVYFAGTVVTLGLSDVRLMALPLLWLVGYVAILSTFIPRLQRVSERQSDARAEMTGRVVDSYTNIQTVKLFAHARREEDYARNAMDGFMQTVHTQMRLLTMMIFFLHAINTALLVGTAAASIFAWQQSLISLGSIAVAIALVMRIRAMSEWIMWESAELFENIGTVQDGIGTIARPIAVTDRSAEELTVARGEIRVENARFDYGRTTKVIHDLSLTIAPGEKVGLVGRSGAGKSTLVNLLMRFYDLEGGRILIDGQDIANVSQESLRRRIGMVTQDTSLLHRSVRDNIIYGRPGASEEDMRYAARLAHADAFIDGLADAKGRRGYDAHVGERGVKLSGGQRQRIALARVFLKDAPILVLDEATSALDSEIEAAIQESLYRLMEGKTVIAIAHRLSTIAAMDRLVVLDEGDIAEMGTHDQLLARGGLYAKLWSRQSGGFLDLEPRAADVA